MPRPPTQDFTPLQVGRHIEIIEKNTEMEDI